MTVGEATGENQSGESRADAEFARIWSPPPGLGALSAVNQSIVGRRYVITAFGFFLVGGLMALLLRTQLALPENDLLGQELYNQLFTMHGTTMMFFFAVPMGEGMAIWLLPMMLGARDLVFPRLSAFGYWCYLFGGLFLLSSFAFGAAPDGGWFNYVPLTSKEYAPGMGIDFWLLGVTFAEISAVAAAVELIVTILKARAPGMSVDRLPIFAWYMLVVAGMIVLAFPPLILGSIMLELQRSFGLPFFDAAAGGDPLLWQHLFWIFGHPEVYIIFLPAAGMVSMIVPTFAQRPLAGYTWVVLAVVGTGFVSMGLWVHHMFAVGIPMLSIGFFSAASMTVSVLTGVQIFAWIATLWLGRPIVTASLLFVAGFIITFVIGGLTGVMVAVIPFDWQAHDSFFVVAHFHYVLIGGMVFPLFAGFYYWFPAVTGRLLSERLGRWNFWLLFVGFNLTFFPMHLTGLLGMPRRVYTYPEGLGWEIPNLISSIGAFGIAASVAAFLINLAISLSTRGRPSGRNPWNAGTLEWATKAPVPPYNFRSIPPVDGRYPLWDHPDLPERIHRGEFHLSSPSSNLRLTTGVSTVSGEPEQVIVLPKPSWLPLIAALALLVALIGFLHQVYWSSMLALAAALLVFAVWIWGHPRKEQAGDVEFAEAHDIPVGAEGPRAVSWWGAVTTIVADGAFFAALVFSYFFLWNEATEWPRGGTFEPELTWPAVGLLVLLVSSVAVHFARRGLHRERPGEVALAIVVAMTLAVAFAAAQASSLFGLGLRPRVEAFSAMIVFISGYQAVHLAAALLMSAFALAQIAFGSSAGMRGLTVHNVALFWHWTVALGAVNWVIVFLSPSFLL